MTHSRSVRYVVKSGLCIGCGLCKVACPHKAIEMVYSDDHGMIFPVVNRGKCKNCGICLDVCYGFKVDHESTSGVSNNVVTFIIGDYIGSYIGFASDHTLRFNSASGGIVTALLVYALKEGLIDGAIVTKMEAGNPPRAKAFIATTEREVISAVGSKYCPVCLAECLETIENGKRYAVVGLPCHIYGMRKLAKYNSKIRNAIRLNIGILCGGMPSYLGTQYLLRIYGVEKQHIKRLEYRGGGWPGRLLIQSEYSGKERKISVPYPDYWRGTFGYFLHYRCTVCHEGFNRWSDISCGDAWLPHLIGMDKIGTSLIITRTEIGEQLLRNAHSKRCIQITPIKSQDLIRSQRGLVQFKYSTLRARVNLSRIARRKLPAFDMNAVPATDPASYLMAIDFYIGNIMATKKGLWWLFDRYLSLKRAVARILVKHAKNNK